MQPTTPQGPTTVGLFDDAPSRPDYIAPARRHFELEFECDGTPYRYHTSAIDSLEAATRGRAAALAQPGFTEAGTRLMACLDRGPSQVLQDFGGLLQQVNRAIDRRRGQP